MLTPNYTRNERVNRFAARVQAMVKATAMSVDTFALTTTATFAWNVKPCVHPSAICTHGKPYARRLQEILT